MKGIDSSLGSARASRAGFGASPKQCSPKKSKVRDGGAPSPAREARALPRLRDRRFRQFHGPFEFRLFALDAEILFVKLGDFFHLVARERRAFGRFREFD